MTTVDRYTKSAAQERGFTGRSTAEAAVWLYLANGDREHGRAPQWRYQHRVGRSHVDFAWPALRIAVEVDGPQHWTPDAMYSDRLRDTELRHLGWLVHHLDTLGGTEMLLDQLAPVVRLAIELHACGYEP